MIDDLTKSLLTDYFESAPRVVDVSSLIRVNPQFRASFEIHRWFEELVVAKLPHVCSVRETSWEELVNFCLDNTKGRVGVIGWAGSQIRCSDPDDCLYIKMRFS